MRKTIQTDGQTGRFTNRRARVRLGLALGFEACSKQCGRLPVESELPLDWHLGFLENATAVKMKDGWLHMLAHAVFWKCTIGIEILPYTA